MATSGTQESAAETTHGPAMTTAGAAPLRLDQPIQPQLVARLREAIVETRLRPGQALSEAEIAAGYGVSRQPVRETFIRLRELGLVQIMPSRGTFVTRISAREVLNARFVREAIECAVARLAARLIDGEGRRRLDAAIADQAAAAAAGDAARFYALDETFHRTIAAIADCDYAARVIEDVRVQLDRVRFLSLPQATPLGTLVAQHSAIAAAIAGRDGDGAEAAMRAHLREILMSLPRLARANPDMFEDIDAPAHAKTLAAER